MLYEESRDVTRTQYEALHWREGYRVSPAEEKEQREPENRKGRTTKRPFPWKLCLLNGCISVTPLLAPVLRPLPWAFRDGSLDMLLLVLMGVVMVGAICGFLVVLLLPLQAIAYFAFRSRIKNDLIWAILFLLPAILPVARPPRQSNTMPKQANGHEYFYASSPAPVWYKQEIKGAGRYYGISGEGYSGEVIVDDEQRLVFVSVERSYL